MKSAVDDGRGAARTLRVRGGGADGQARARGDAGREGDQGATRASASDTGGDAPNGRPRGGGPARGRDAQLADGRETARTGHESGDARPSQRQRCAEPRADGGSAERAEPAGDMSGRAAGREMVGVRCWTQCELVCALYEPVCVTRLVTLVCPRNVVRSLTGVTYHYFNYKDFIILLGAVWARTNEVS